MPHIYSLLSLLPSNSAKLSNISRLTYNTLLLPAIPAQRFLAYVLMPLPPYGEYTAINSACFDVCIIGMPGILSSSATCAKISFKICAAGWYLNITGYSLCPV